MNPASSPGTAAADSEASELDSSLWSVAEVVAHAQRHGTPCEVVLAAEAWKGFGPSAYGTVIMPEADQGLDSPGATFRELKVARSAGTGPNGGTVWLESDFVDRVPHMRGQMVTLRGTLSKAGDEYTVDRLQSAEPVGAPGVFSTWRERQATLAGLPGELAAPEAGRRLPNLAQVRSEMVDRVLAGPNLPLMWIGREHIDAYGDVTAADEAVEELLVAAGARTAGPQAVHWLVAALEAATPQTCAAVVIARGGGSVTDLALFDDARLLAAIAGCAVPTIVAVGHADNHPLAEAVATWAVAMPGHLSEALGVIAAGREAAGLPVRGDTGAVRALQGSLAAAKKQAAEAAAQEREEAERVRTQQAEGDNPWHTAAREAAAEIAPEHGVSTDTLIDIRGEGVDLTHNATGGRTGRGATPPQARTIDEVLDGDVEYIDTPAASPAATDVWDDGDVESVRELTPEELEQEQTEREWTEDLRVLAARRAEGRCRTFAGAWLVAGPLVALLAAELSPWGWLDYLLGFVIIATCTVRALMWWMEPNNLGKPVSKMARMNLDEAGEEPKADADVDLQDLTPEEEARLQEEREEAEALALAEAEARLRRACLIRAIQLVVGVLLVGPVFVGLLPWGAAGKLLGVLIVLIGLGVAFLLVMVPTSLNPGVGRLLGIDVEVETPATAGPLTVRERINQEYRDARTIADYNRAHAEHRDLDLVADGS